VRRREAKENNARARRRDERHGARARRETAPPTAMDDGPKCEWSARRDDDDDETDDERDGRRWTMTGE